MSEILTPELTAQVLERITADQEVGVVPMTVECFADLHDYVDANEYFDDCIGDISDYAYTETVAAVDAVLWERASSKGTRAVVDQVSTELGLAPFVRVSGSMFVTNVSDNYSVSITPAVVEDEDEWLFIHIEGFVTYERTGKCVRTADVAAEVRALLQAETDWSN